ncbi:MAG: 3-deoxy-7-phosphoheptulonate synthase, partial [Candidatus Dormibacteraceae bacterium]
MIIVMSQQATSDQIEEVRSRIRALKLHPEQLQGKERIVIGVIGSNAYTHHESFSHLQGIQEILQVSKPYKLASREWQQQDSVIDVSGVP